MKKLILPLLLCVSGVLSAQTQFTRQAMTLSSKAALSAPKIACGVDLSDYTGSKSIGDTIWTYNTTNAATGAINAFGQYFEAPQPITLAGGIFAGMKAVTGSATVRLSVYNADANYAPTGAALATKDTVISGPAATGVGYVQLLFTTPVTVTGNYVITVENVSATQYRFVTNNDENFSGRGEGFAFYKAEGTWFNLLVDESIDCDVLIAPIYVTSATANFTLAASACVGTPVTTVNTSSALFNSRFYNLYKFNNYFNGTPDSTYLWTTPARNTYGNTVTLNPAAAGALNVKLTAKKLGWFANCQDTITKTITYNAADNATFAYSSNTFCAGASNPVPTVSTPGTFSASAGLNFVSTTTGEINLATTPNGSYTVTYTTTGPCPASSNQTVTVTSAPDASFSYSAASFCVGSANPFPVFGTGAGAGTFSSTTGLAINSGTGEINLATSTPGTYTVTNTIAASGSCAASSDTYDVTVKAQPTATLSGGGGICAGSGNTVNVSVALTGTGPWSVTASNGSTTFPAVPVSTSPYTIPVNEAGAGTYTITTVTDASTCSNTGTGSATVTVNPIPAVNAVSNQTVCNGTTTNAITFSSATAGSTFAWTNSQTSIGLGAGGNGNIAPFSATNTTGSPVTATISVVPTAAGCAGSASTFTITVNPSPTVAYTTLPTLICVYNNDLTLSGATPAGGTYSGPGVTGTTFDPTAAGVGNKTITYTYTDANNCTGTATANIEVGECLSVDESVAAGNLVLFPNPAATHVTFTFNGNTVDQAEVSILSLDGKVVYQNRFFGNQGTIDVSTLARSTYFVRIKANDKETTSKLVLN